MNGDVPSVTWQIGMPTGLGNIIYTQEGMENILNHNTIIELIIVMEVRDENNTKF